LLAKIRDLERVDEGLQHRSVALQQLLEASVYRRPRISTEPPAASIFAFAEADTEWARTRSARSISPRPSTFTGLPDRISPRSWSTSGVISVPPSKACVRRSRLITANSCRFGLVKPLSFGTRRCRG